MSVTQVPIRPVAKATRTRALFGFVLVILAAVLLAWFGAGQLRGETTPSGLTFRTIQKGDGPLITPNDGVLIEYEGRLPDGTVFDTTAGKSAVPMIAGQVIPGFSEALQKMQKGGRYKFRIPGNLAYGATPPAGSPIPPNSPLDFTVHVVQVVPNAAQMMQMQQQMQQGAAGAGAEGAGAGAEGAGATTMPPPPGE
ncbi:MULTISPECIES: FKBP-type peptidyl-prolyl cis-trans isomerase [Sphingomonas]|uniref:FKBP-type peptidyl-prolyl cis-trans isomerase n=1 Tax=Sphingomonas TaxID=13687 RepID=UPI000DEEDE94|nr:MULTISPECIES: FKBP-type peptidyl-prolyl cis-trans isomerase [Sphingomonas]